MSAHKRICEITAALKNRPLIFFGTRGADAESLLKIPNFASLFSLIAPLQSSTVEETCLETITRERVELDDYTIDNDTRPVVSEIRRKLLRALERPSVLLTYRPCAFLSSAWFPRSDRVTYLGLFHGHQSCFEHKAWVETQLAANGVRVLPWRFFADEESEIIKEWVSTEPIVLRANRSDGGIGVRYVPDLDSLDAQWPSHNDGFLAATTFLSDSISLNLGVCVFQDGSVSFHGPSVQLIGIPELTRRHFGYCGNDFAAASQLDKDIWQQLERLAKTVAQWLRRQGYLGAFGIDALVYDGQVYVSEINPRFQGSSLLSTRLDAMLDRPDIFLEHIAAFLGLQKPKIQPLDELAAIQPPLAHAVLHNLENTTTHLSTSEQNDDKVELRLAPEEDIKIPPDGIIYELVFQRQIIDSKGLLNNRPLKQFNTPT